MKEKDLDVCEMAVSHTAIQVDGIPSTQDGRVLTFVGPDLIVRYGAPRARIGELFRLATDEEFSHRDARCSPCARVRPLSPRIKERICTEAG